MSPATAPVADDVDFAFLAERFKVSGGGIKNIVLHAAFLAAEEDAPICMRHLVRSAVGELRKNEIVVVREDLGKYAALAFDRRKKSRPSFSGGAALYVVWRPVNCRRRGGGALASVLP